MSEMSSMLERRLPEVTQHIEADYERLAKGVGILQSASHDGYAGKYIFTGSESYYYWDSLKLATSDVLDQNGLRVLDIGCGAGSVVREYNKKNPKDNKAYGITAYAYGEQDPAIITGNLHYLDTLYPADLEPVDRCFSRLTMVHLADPLSVLEMMARHTKKGGILVHDGVTLRADPGSIIAAEIVQYLTQSGNFKAIGLNASYIKEHYIDSPKLHDDAASNVLPPMILQRTSPTDHPVELPISYEINQETGQWQYVVA